LNTIPIEPNSLSEIRKKDKSEKKKSRKKSKKKSKKNILSENEQENDVMSPEELDEDGRVPAPKQPAAFILGNLKAGAGKSGPS
jgi:anti-sigma28 factor (negative regulator of flagellin synthesis)